MDAEWEKQFEDHRKRLKEITKLLVDNSGDIDQESSNDLLRKIRDVVIDSVVVRTNVSKITTVLENTLRQIDASEDMERVKVQELYDTESEKEVIVPTFNYVSEFENFLASLKQDAEDSFVVSQQTETSTVDPWTKKPIEHPVRSKTCGHIYDKNSIRAITKKKKEFKCPYIGCKLRIAVNELEED